MIIARLFCLICHNCDSDDTIYITWVYFQCNTGHYHWYTLHGNYHIGSLTFGLWPHPVDFINIQAVPSSEGREGGRAEATHPEGLTSLQRLFLVEIASACLFVGVGENRKLYDLCISWQATEHFIWQEEIFIILCKTWLIFSVYLSSTSELKCFSTLKHGMDYSNKPIKLFQLLPSHWVLWH